MEGRTILIECYVPLFVTMNDDNINWNILKTSSIKQCFLDAEPTKNCLNVKGYITVMIEPNPLALTSGGYYEVKTPIANTAIISITLLDETVIDNPLYEPLMTNHSLAP